MPSIIEIYRQYPESLSVYFKSEAEAADCERRAEMGDDRAMRIMSLAYDARHKHVFRYVGGTSEIDGPWMIREGEDGFQSYNAKYHQTGMEYITLDSAKRNKFHAEARKHHNLEALEFAASVHAGNRSATTRYPEWRLNYWGALKSAATLLPAGSARHEVAAKTMVTCDHTGNNDRTHTNSNFQVLYFDPRARDDLHKRSANPDWPDDGWDTTYTKFDWVFDRKYVVALEICAKAGSALAARRLSVIYSQKIFEEKQITKNWLRSNEYQVNPLYDSAKAKEWERVAEHLEGKTTPLEREKFLKEFLYSQDTTPEGLYNIGYALYHNAQIGDPERGIDYLKHAANLGDANAARELGEIYQDRFDAKGENADLGLAYFWYNASAHPNAKVRVAYLQKAYPELAAATLNENGIRNPSKAHVAQYPASAWFVDVPITDVSNLIRNPAHGGIVTRMELATQAIDDHVAEFEQMTQGIQARIEEIVVRQMVLDGRLEASKAAELTALAKNDQLLSQQDTSRVAIAKSEDRWLRETVLNLGSSVALTIVTGMPGDQAARMLVGNVSRASGFRGAVDSERNYHEALIAELEMRKIDTGEFSGEINALSREIQALADSRPMQQLIKDETRARALTEGYLRQRILKSGLENCRSLEEYAKQSGLPSLDALLEAFEEGDERLSAALNNLCYGHADSNDMEVLLVDANRMQGNDLAPHEKALKRFVERVVKGNIGHFMTRASQIDVIADLGLIDFGTMNVDHRFSVPELVRGTRELTTEEQGARQVDAATRLALTSMFSQQFGVTHIGQYDVNRMFGFYLHRHGRDQLIAAELHDGLVSDELADKRVSARTPREMRGFVERAKESAKRGREDLPNVGDLFLRVCGYEYFLPQAVITSGQGNRFKENPEAPVAYPMVNRVVQSFIEQMSLTDLPTYRQQIGQELDSVIAQTFIDFFQEVGRAHASAFATDRAQLREAHAHDNYGVRFDTYEDKITEAALAEFPLFMQLYERNLRKELLTAPEDTAALIQQQIEDLPVAAKEYLKPAIPHPSSFQARDEARRNNYRGANMTEPWHFKA